MTKYFSKNSLLKLTIILLLFFLSAGCGKNMYEQGVRSYEKGDLSDAKICFIQAKREGNNSAMAFYYLGLISGIHINDKSYQKDAVGFFREALENKKGLPDSLLPYINMEIGKAYRRIGQIDSAIKYLENTIELNQNIPEALINLGSLYMDKGEYHKDKRGFPRAIELYEKAIKLDSSLVSEIGADLVEAYGGVSPFLIEEVKLDKYILGIKKAIKYDPNNSKLYCHLGEAYSIKKDYDNAIEALKKAIEITSTSTNKDIDYLHYCLGNVYREKGIINQAIIHYREAIKISEKVSGLNRKFSYPHIFFWFAYCLFEKGEKSLARKYLRMSEGYVTSEYAKENATGQFAILIKEIAEEIHKREKAEKEEYERKLEYWLDTIDQYARLFKLRWSDWRCYGSGVESWYFSDDRTRSYILGYGGVVWEMSRAKSSLKALRILLTTEVNDESLLIEWGGVDFATIVIKAINNLYPLKHE